MLKRKHFPQAFYLLKEVGLAQEAYHYPEEVPRTDAFKIHFFKMVTKDKKLAAINPILAG